MTEPRRAQRWIGKTWFHRCFGASTLCYALGNREEKDMVPSLEADHRLAIKSFIDKEDLEEEVRDIE